MRFSDSHTESEIIFIQNQNSRFYMQVKQNRETI